MPSWLTNLLSMTSTHYRDYIVGTQLSDNVIQHHTLPWPPPPIREVDPRTLQHQNIDDGAGRIMTASHGSSLDVRINSPQNTSPTDPLAWSTPVFTTVIDSEKEEMKKEIEELKKAIAQLQERIEDLTFDPPHKF